MQVDLKYGQGVKSVHIPDKADVRLLQPDQVPVLGALTTTLETSLTAPLNSAALGDRLRQSAPERVAIVIPDDTRPTPVKELLPGIARQIFTALPKLKPADLVILIGGGLHPPLDREAQARLLPDALVPGCTILAHDAHNARMAAFGVTRRGTPVKINAALAAADFMISIGQIDPHQFVGFTGGAKGVVIGCGAPETIQHNHSLMFGANAEVGQLAGNPVREDLNEAGHLIGIDFAVNVVLDADKRVVRLLAGDPDAVLLEGAQTCAELYGVSVDSKFDIVIASCGGAPKDNVLYQAQKGLNLCSRAVKKGGKILLLAACQQGIGDDVYFDYVCQFASPAEVLEDFKQLGFTMGAHKAYLFGRTLVDYDVAVFSDLDPGIMGQCHLRAAEPARIIGEWVAAFEGRPQVAVVPYANTTYFF
ncbi:MAG: nickel-dependent lactate racemase [Desulfosarcinaceae bacterium]|nr:nickel-dependent lactate racemase [Desulfosarcinaceae bacterium]